MPDFPGRLSLSSYLVPPTSPVSVLDFTIRLNTDLTYADVCQRFRKAAAAGPLRRLLGFTEDPLVSSDLVNASQSAVVDSKAGQQVSGDTIRLVAW